jgi:hypothetical protein
MYKNVSTLSNKLLYNKLVNVKFSKPIGKHYWINYLVLSEKPNTSSLSFFIFKFLEEKKLKMFRLKLFRFIIPNKILLFNWKIVGNSLCNFCKSDENYSHYFYLGLPKRVLDNISEFNEGFGNRNQNYFETYSTSI